jgi:bifunctional UDP-N-acetylglucosamine pyrophosphorylase/glucosamine-1-phosphate N-acetyltransferase
MSLSFDYYFQKPEKFPIPELLDGITYPHELLERAREYLKGRDSFVGEGSVIPDGAHILGPVYIGKNVEIMPGALLRPYTIVGDNCCVGHGSELKRCVMFGGSKVASLSFVGDSVLGAAARVGSGVITANRKFDQSDVTIRFGTARVPLGGSYFGLVLGDSSRLGASCVTQPGTHIGRHTWIFPMTNVRGFIPSGKRVLAKTELIVTENEIVELKP